LERALDLVGRLHLEVSYNLAAQIADSHRKLVDRIEELKANKFEDDKGSESDEEDPHAHSSHDNNDLQHVSPDSSHAPNKRNFGADGVDANLGFTRRVRAKNAFP
jgi:G3E family GTPase